MTEQKKKYYIIIKDIGQWSEKYRLSRNDTELTSCRERAYQFAESSAKQFVRKFNKKWQSYGYGKHIYARLEEVGELHE